MKRLYILLITLLFTAGTAAAQQKTVIAGTLLGSNGKPMARGDVHLFRPNQLKPLVTTEVHKDGSFTITTTETGLAILKCTGTGHQVSELPILIEQPDTILVGVQLQAYAYPKRIDSVAVMGDFNDFTYATARPMELQDDSTFVAEFATDAPQFSYQIICPGVERVNGTMADNFNYDGTGKYRSVVRPANGKVRITFDPRQLLRSKASAIIEWGDSTRGEFATLYGQILQRREAYRMALQRYLKAGNDIRLFSYDWRPVLRRLAGRIRSERDSATRNLLLISYLDLGTCDATKDLDPAIVQQALDVIPPTSHLWAVNPRLVTMAIGRTGQDSHYCSYLESVLDQNSDPCIKAPLIYDELVAARHRSDFDTAKIYYDRLMAEFAATPYAGMARAEFASK
jgi:hypothetical protein